MVRVMKTLIPGDPNVVREFDLTKPENIFAQTVDITSKSIESKMAASSAAGTG